MTRSRFFYSVTPTPLKSMQIELPQPNVFQIYMTYIWYGGLEEFLFDVYHLVRKTFIMILKPQPVDSPSSRCQTNIVVIATICNLFKAIPKQSHPPTSHAIWTALTVLQKHIPAYICSTTSVRSQTQKTSRGNTAYATNRRIDRTTSKRTTLSDRK